MLIFIGFLFGTIFGSFLNVVIYRIPKDESVVFTPSHCQSCQTPLKIWHNIPLLSWLFLRGKCSFCKTSISSQYPLIEVASGVIFSFIAYKYGINFPSFMIAMSFLMLLALSMIDLKYMMVPDSLNLLAIFFAIFGAWSLQGVIENFTNALLFAGGFTLLRFTLSYYLTKKLILLAEKTKTSWNKHFDRTPFVEAMGEGDIMVGATMGALLGVPLTLVAIFVSALIALPVLLWLQYTTKKQPRVPYVPFLAFATLLVMLFDSPIMHYIEINY